MENHQPARMKNQRRDLVAICVLLPGLLLGCSDETALEKDSQAASTNLSTQPHLDATSFDTRPGSKKLLSHPVSRIESVAGALQTSRDANADHLSATMTELAKSADAFLLNPDPDLQHSFQVAWLAAHNAWLDLLYVARLPELDSASFDTSLAADLVDAWPISPGFIDSLPEYLNSGLVNDQTIDLTPASVIKEHGVTSTEEVAVGFHVLEYYAFARPLEDFDTQANNSDRRKLLISIVSAILGQHLDDYVKSQKTPEVIDYQHYVRQLVTALKERNQRMQEVMSVEGQHSQFSQSSLGNMETQLRSIGSVLNTAGLREILQELDPGLTASLASSLSQALALLSVKQEAVVLQNNSADLEDMSFENFRSSDEGSSMARHLAEITAGLAEFERILP